MINNASNLNAGDYCLVCKEYYLDFPSDFEQAVVIKRDEYDDNFYHVKLLKSNKILFVEDKSLLLVKKKSKLDLELIYNSKLEKGGSYNVTSENGTHLKASFYFDNKQEQEMAKKYAERYMKNYNLI